MHSIYVKEMDDGVDLGGELELLWKMSLNRTVVHNTYDVESTGNNGVTLNKDNYIAPPPYRISEDQKKSNIRNGIIWGVVEASNNENVYIDFELYDEDQNRAISGNDSTDDLGEERYLFHPSQLARNKSTYKNLIIKDEDEDNIVEVTFEIIKMTSEEYFEHIRVNIAKCDELVQKTYATERKLGPGFLVRNETDFDLDISLNQVGPLYYGKVAPGETFYRKTGAVWFTIEASVNIDGEDKYDVWDCIAPALEFSIEVLQTAFSAGSALAIKGGVAAAYHSANKISTFEKIWKVIDKANDIKADIESVYEVANFVNENFIEEFTYNSKFGCYAGPPWGDHYIKLYTITGGPQAPCIDADGKVTVKESLPLEIKGPFTNNSY